MNRRRTLALLMAPLLGAQTPRVLVYTRNHVTNGKGYVHDNIAASVAMIQELGAQHGFAADHSADPAVFTVQNLKKYRALVFSNSNNEAFESEAQRSAFRSFVEEGGGLAGIHSATASERQWAEFPKIMGGRFVRHPRMQRFMVRVADPDHPATRGMPAAFEWDDECYYNNELAPGMRVLLVTDPAKLDDPKKAEYPGERFGDALPLAWAHRFGRGRVFYSALGHKIEHYSDALLRRHVMGGLEWVLGRG